MIKIFIASVVAVLAITAAFSAGKEENNQYSMEILSVIDGDTYRALVEIWPGLVQSINVRVRGIDTPEKNTSGGECPSHEKALAFKAARIAEGALKSAYRVYITKVGLGKYAGRVIGEVVLVNRDGSKYLMSDFLIKSGVAVKYDGGKRSTDWCAKAVIRS